MNLTMAIVYGAIGGSLRGLLAMYGHIERWLEIRREQHRSRRRGLPARFRGSADWSAEIAGTMVQVLLATIAAAILYGTDTVSTVVGLILGGASAPAILAQLGQVRAVTRAVAGPARGKPSAAGGDDGRRGSPPEAPRTLVPVAGAVPEARTAGDLDRELGDG